MTNTSPKLVKVFCGELCRSAECSSTELNLRTRKIDGLEANITVKYDEFVRAPENLPPKILDLLQIAAYVFCADRLVNRGARESLSNDAWARSFEFHIPVLDYDFWNNPALQNALSEALVFMTGDRKYRFVFKPSRLGHLPQTVRQLSIFKDEFEFYDGIENADVLLFSGGLDSLAGIVERLHTYPNTKQIIISHKSSKTVIRTQTKIIEHLQKRYENLILPCRFDCHIRKTPSKEESQRTRMFLFSSFAFAICQCAAKRSLYVYENGITSINLSVQTDVINARASRTTHPKTLGLMNKVFQFFDTKFAILTPYYDKTKEDVFKIFGTYDEKELLASSVSCSSTRNNPEASRHCGCCSQCVDRRFAAYASGLHGYDAEYEDDFITKIPNDETRQRLWQALRLACAERLRTPNELLKNYPEETLDIVEYWHCDNQEDSVAEIYSLFSRYGDSVLRAAKAMQLKHDDLSAPIANDSLLSMLASREYLKTPTQIRVEEIDKILKASIPQAFYTAKPQNENDFSNKIQALLTAAGGDFTREYPVLRFGISSYRADLSEDSLIIESKYLRTRTSPSVATEGIAADITKVSNMPVLFVVYDPERKISDDTVFISSFENKRPFCFVRIFR